MRTLALKDILPTNNPAANIISLSRPLTWINTNPTHPSGTAATSPATGNTNSSSVAVSEPPRSWEWEYYSPPTDQTIEGPAKSSTGGASTAAISPLVHQFLLDRSPAEISHDQRCNRDRWGAHIPQSHGHGSCLASSGASRNAERNKSG
jgi:hypothetical protein